MDTEKIPLPGEHWVEVRSVVTRRMRKAFRAAGIKGFLGGIQNGHTGGDLSDPEAIKALVMAHPDQWNLDAVDDAFLLQGIVTWSFPEPVSLEALDDLPAATTDVILEHLRALYTEPTGDALKN